MTERAARAGYRVERLLGQGGMGAVFSAMQEEDGRRVALKVLSAALDSEVDRARFMREGRVAAAINHPNTVFVYRVTEVDGTPLIAMELVEGTTLDERVERDGPLAEGEAIEVMLQVIDGLEAANARGILHRDIKPANCFVDADRRVKVGDFGLSRIAEQADELKLTQTGMFLGTPLFASPEQMLGETLDLRADLYSVGATLYFLLTGAHPYPATNLAQLMAQVYQGVPVPLATRRPELSPALGTVVMRCLARERDARPASYAELRATLLACRPAAHRPAPPGRRLAAGALDSYALLTITQPLAVLAGTAVGLPEAAMTSAPTTAGSLFVVALTLPFQLAWSGWMEGRFGWSPGKRLMGLRVVDAGGEVPGMRRSMARALLMVLPSVAGAAATALVSTPDDVSALDLAVWLALWLGLFLRVRPANGWLAEHDRLTGTRVVRALASTREERAVNPTGGQSPPEATGERLGAFDVIGPLPGATGVLRGFDTVLGRAVWIWRHAPGTPPLPAADRDAARHSALRWIGGRRTAEEAWDVYAAIPGTMLRERLQRAASWPTCHQWLSTLARELETPREEPPSRALTLEQLWVTDDDALVVLPFPLALEGAPPAAARPVLSALAAAIEALPDGQTGRAGWSFGARRTLAEALRPEATPASVLAAAAQEGDPVVGMTGARRLALWSLSAAPLVAVALFLAMVSLLADSVRAFNPVRLSAWAFALGGAVAVLATPILRRGPMLRTLGVEVLTIAGARAGRLRGTLRQLVAWTPAALLPQVMVWAMVPSPPLPLEALLAGVLLLVAWMAALLVTGWRAPHRGLAERLTGTVLVPE
jgi:hypothetical protein